MPFELVAYGYLETGVKESIKTLIEHHQKKDAKHIAVDIKKLNDFVGVLGSYNEDRRISSELLLKIIELIGNDEEKTLLLNAVVFYERSKIPRTPYGSTFLESLTHSLRLNAENQPSDDDLCVMYSAYLAFLEAQIFKIDEKNHPICRDKHPFSSIKGYNVLQDFKNLTHELYAIKIRRIDLAVQEHEAAARPASAHSGYFSGWFSTSSSSVKPRLTVNSDASNLLGPK